jgi:hypothetical protein
VERHFTWRFWVEGVAAGAASLLLVVTLVWPTWIELVFGMDPDSGNGVVEWLTVLVAAICSLASSALALREWRGSLWRTVPTASASGTASSDPT